MRLNQYIAASTGMSRRAADKVISAGRVVVNDAPAALGQFIQDNDTVELDGKILAPNLTKTVVILNKPAGYVSSRDGQGSKTIYDLLPDDLHGLKPVGRLDKESSGLLLLTDDGGLANELTHPRYQKEKTYEVTLERELASEDLEKITKQGIQLNDGLSKLKLESADDDGIKWQVKMSEGRNRQIRRTFAALGYKVNHLHRIEFGKYRLEKLTKGNWRKF